MTPSRRNMETNCAGPLSLDFWYLFLLEFYNNTDSIVDNMTLEADYTAGM